MTNPNPGIVDLTNSDEESEGPLRNIAQARDERDRLEKQRHNRESNEGPKAHSDTPHIKQERDKISPDKRKARFPPFKRKARSNSPEWQDAGFLVGDQMKKSSWRDHMKKKAPSGAGSTAHTEPQMKQKDSTIPSHKQGPSSQVANAVQTGASPAKKARATCSPVTATNATCKAKSNITEASSTMKPNNGGSLLGLVRQIKHKQSSQIDEENPPDPKSFNSRRPHLNDDSQVEKEHQTHVQEEEEEESRKPAAHGDVAVNPRDTACSNVIGASSARESSKKRNLPDLSPSKDDNQDQGSTDETPCGSPPKRSRTDHGGESRAGIFLANAVGSPPVGSPRRKPVLVRQDPRQIEKICPKTRKVLKTFSCFKEAADAATISTQKWNFIDALENYRIYGHHCIYNGYMWRFQDEAVARGRVEEDPPKIESLQLDNAPIKLNGRSHGGIATQKEGDENCGASALTPASTGADSPEESMISRSSSQKSLRASSPSFGSPAGVYSFAVAVTIEAGQSPAVGLKTTGLDDEGGSKENAAGDHFPATGAEHGDGGDVVGKRDNDEDDPSDDDGNKIDNALSIVGEAEEIAKDGDATEQDEISHKSRDLLTDESQDGAVSVPVYCHGNDGDSTRVVETSQEEEDDLDAASTTSHHTGPDSYSDDPIQSEVESSLSSPSHKYLWLLSLLSAFIVSLLLVLYFHFKCGGLGNIMKIIMDIVKKCGYQVPTPSSQPTASNFYPPALPWNVQKWL